MVQVTYFCYYNEMYEAFIDWTCTWDGGRQWIQAEFPS